MARYPTAPLAGGSFLAAWGVVEASGSRTAGGLVLLAGGLLCARAWRARHGSAEAARLAGVMLAAFVLSHLLGLLIGSWPAVLVCALGTSAVIWTRADAPRRALWAREG